MNETPVGERIGTVIDDKYRVDSLLGKGGMGKVFRVTHLQLNKVFALKLMNFEKVDSSGASPTDASQIARFKRETEVLVKVNHPNVVMVTDFGILLPDNVPYIVMEYIEGGTLRQMMKESGKLTEKEVTHIAKQVCAGLHAAHLQSVVHRDLKPENVMIQKLGDGTIMPRVLDFGIAKLLARPGEEGESLTGTNLPGTPKYMAPEQMFGGKVDARADVFAIGLMVYEMLTGVLPLVLMSEVKPLTTFRPELSPRLNDIVMKAIAKDPDDRYETAHDFKRALEELEHDSIVEAEIVKRTKMFGEISGTNTQRVTASNRALMAGSGSTLKIPAATTSMTGAELAGDAAPRKSRAGLIVALIVVVLGGGFGGLWALSPDFRQLFTGPTKTEVKLDPTLLPPFSSVKGGEFQMGAAQGYPLVQPVHKVVVKSFEVSKYLVTNRQYAEFVKLTNHRPPSHWRGNAPPSDIMDKPVTNVSWDDANDYCTWLGKQTAKSVRLIKEEEWEYLARDAAHFGINEILDPTYIEWTGTTIIPYPGSPIPTIPPDIARAKIFRGESVDPDAKKADPTTSRSFQLPDFVKDNLGFRVAGDAGEGK